MLAGPVYNRKETNGDTEVRGIRESGEDVNVALSAPCSKGPPFSPWNSTPRDLVVGFKLLSGGHGMRGGESFGNAVACVRGMGWGQTWS